MSKCSTCGGKANGQGGKGGSAIGKYSGGGDSNRGYERAGQFKVTIYPSDVSLSPFDRYAPAREPKSPGQGLYKMASPLERYKPPKSAHESDFFVMDAFYRAAEPRHYGPMKHPPASMTEIEEENRRKKFQTNL